MFYDLKEVHLLIAILKQHHLEPKYMEIIFHDNILPLENEIDIHAIVKKDH